MCIFGNPHHSEELNTLPTYVELPLLQTVVCCQRIKEEMSMEHFSSVSLIDYSFEPFTRAERIVEAEYVVVLVVRIAWMKLTPVSSPHLYW